MLNTIVYKDRVDAGKQLADILEEQVIPSPIVLALPRGGVPVGYEIAKALQCPLDILVVRKIGSPSNPEFAIGAIAEDGVNVMQAESIEEQKISREDIRKILYEELTELERRVALYHSNRPLPQLHDKTVILVDDGLATGLTMRAALKAVKKHKPQTIIVAVPIAALEIALAMKNYIDEMICPVTPPELEAIGSFYEKFDPVSDEEVLTILRKVQEFETKNSY